MNLNVIKSFWNCWDNWEKFLIWLVRHGWCVLRGSCLVPGGDVRSAGWRVVAAGRAAPDCTAPLLPSVLPLPLHHPPTSTLQCCSSRGQMTQIASRPAPPARQITSLPGPATFHKIQAIQIRAQNYSPEKYRWGGTAVKTSCKTRFGIKHWANSPLPFLVEPVMWLFPLCGRLAH